MEEFSFCFVSYSPTYYVFAAEKSQFFILRARNRIMFTWRVFFDNNCDATIVKKSIT